MRRGRPEGNKKKGTEGSRAIRTFSQTIHFLYHKYQNCVLQPIPGLIMCYATIL